MNEIKKMVAYKDFGGHLSRYVVFYKKGYYADMYKFCDCYLKELPKKYNLMYRLDGERIAVFEDLDCLGLTLCDAANGYDNLTGRMVPFLTARDNPTDDIIKKYGFVNGFQRVRFKNGEFGFIRESDLKIMPNRFDICGDFNKYGLALVGKNQKINYIDTDFKVFEHNINNPTKAIGIPVDYLISHDNDLTFRDYEKVFFPLRKTDIKDDMIGFEQMSTFFEGEKPFALFGNIYQNYVVPITPQGEIAGFFNFYQPKNKETIILNKNLVNLDTINNCCILYDDSLGNNPTIYLPNGISFTADDIFRFAYEFDLMKIVIEDSINNYNKNNIKYDKDVVEYYKKNNIKYYALASREIITISELIKRIISLDKFMEIVNEYPKGYDNSFVKKLIK